MDVLGIAAIVVSILVALLHLWDTNRIRLAEHEIKKIDALKVDVKDFQKELSLLQAFVARADQKLGDMNGTQLRDLQTEQARQGEQLRILMKWIERHREES